MNLEDKRCCGFDTGADKPTLLGLMTVAFPLWLSAAAAAKIIAPACRNKADTIGRAAGAALRVMNAGMDGQRRMAASKFIYPRAPKLAGLVYKYFNPALLGAFWFALTALAGLLIWILKR